MATETTALDEFLSSINNEPVYEQQPLVADQTVVQEYVTPTTETPTLPRAGLETYQPQNIKDRSLGFQVFRGTYTLDVLAQDKEFKLRSESFMESIQDDEDIFEYLIDSDFPLSSAFVSSEQVKGWCVQAQENSHQ